MSASTYLLVHGAYGGAWCWRDLGAEFERRGVKWRAVDLPSSRIGADSSTNLVDDAVAVVAAATGDGPYVLVGHSYGGAVVAESAPQIPRLQKCIYISAVLPNINQSAYDAIRIIEGRTLLDEATEVDGEVLKLNPQLAPAALYGDCTPEVTQWAVQQLSTQTIASLRFHRAAASVDVESLYIACSRDESVVPELQKVMSQRCDAEVILESDHSPFLSHPSILLDAILAQA